VFGGKNVVSGIGYENNENNLFDGANKRIKGIEKTIANMTPEQLAKSTLPGKVAKFQKELDDAVAAKAEFTRGKLATRNQIVDGKAASSKAQQKSLNKAVEALAAEYDYQKKNDPRPGKGDPDPTTTSIVNKAKAQIGMPQNLSFNTGGGGEPSCFLPGTLVTMADGSTKKIIDVDIGDDVAVGGKVFATGKFLNTELYDYKGIKVSGSHMVNEDGVWLRVRDTKHGISLGNDENIVYVFGAENRRILINGILFTDYFEVPEQNKLLENEKDFFKNWRNHGENISDKNVDILNAI